jgi:hypothetical protein
MILKLLTIKSFGLDNWLYFIPPEEKRRMVASLVEILKVPAFKMPVREIFFFLRFKRAVQSSKGTQGKGKKLLYVVSLSVAW